MLNIKCLASPTTQPLICIPKRFVWIIISMNTTPRIHPVFFPVHLSWRPHAQLWPSATSTDPNQCTTQLPSPGEYGHGPPLMFFGSNDMKFIRDQVGSSHDNWWVRGSLCVCVCVCVGRGRVGLFSALALRDWGHFCGICCSQSAGAKSIWCAGPRSSPGPPARTSLYFPYRWQDCPPGPSPAAPRRPPSAP